MALSLCFASGRICRHGILQQLGKQLALLLCSERAGPANELLLNSRAQTRLSFTPLNRIKQHLAGNISYSGLFTITKRGAFLIAVSDPNHKCIKVYLPCLL